MPALAYIVSDWELSPRFLIDFLFDSEQDTLPGYVNLSEPVSSSLISPFLIL